MTSTWTQTSSPDTESLCSASIDWHLSSNLSALCMLSHQNVSVSFLEQQRHHIYVLHLMGNTGNTCGHSWESDFYCWEPEFPSPIVARTLTNNRLADLPTHGGGARDASTSKSTRVSSKCGLPHLQLICCSSTWLTTVQDLTLAPEADFSSNFLFSMIFNSQPMISCLLITVSKSKYNF